MKKLYYVLIVFMFCAGYQSPRAENKTTDYVTISEGVRSQTLKDGKGTVIGKRIEMRDPRAEGWFEAEKSSSGSYQLTAKGSIDADAAEADELDNAGGC